MKQIIDNIYTFDNLMAGRVYLIKDPDRLTLIDAGLGIAPSRIIRQIQQRGFDPNQIKHILITHAHGDHVGGLPKLKQLTGASVICSTRERPIVEGREKISAAPKEDLSGIWRIIPVPQQIVGAPVDSTVNDGDALDDVFGGLQIVATPGHSPGQIAFWQPEKRILFVGDTLMHLLGKLRLPMAVATPDMAQAKRSIKRIAELEPSILCFGHGQPWKHNTADALHHFADSLQV